MNMDALIFGVAAEGFDDVCPNRTNSAHLCNLHEEVGTHGEAEENLTGCFLDGEATLHESTDIGYAHSESIGDFLNIVGTAAAEYIRASHDSLQSRSIGNSPLCSLGHFIVELAHGSKGLAIYDHLSDGVCTYEALQDLGVLTIGFESSSNEGEHRHSGCTCIYIEGELFKLQTLKYLMHIIESGNATANIAHLLSIGSVDVLKGGVIYLHIVDSGAMIILELQESIVLLGHGLVAGLSNAPGLAYIAVLTSTAEEVAFARQYTLRQDVISVFLGVHRLKGNILISLGVHDLVEGSSLQQSLAGFLPLFVRRRLKLVEGNFGEIGFFIGFLQDGLQVKIPLILDLLFFYHWNPPLIK